MAGNSRNSKRLKTSHVVKEVASLSDFPDEILHIILSFLDTKSAVRTGILSRRWRCLWKDVPVLNFLPKSFLKLASFRKHVYRLLSSRSHRTPVRDVVFDVRGYTSQETWGHITKTIEQIMKYAAGHDGGGLDRLSIIGAKKNLYFCNFDANIIAGNHHASLKTMMLEECSLCDVVEADGVGFTSCTTLGFKLLTTLELRECAISPYYPMVPFDLIGDLPCLKYLKLIHCYVAYPDSWLVISGPQLLDLEIKFPDFHCWYEVTAPKLKSLCLSGEQIDECLWNKLSLPALDHANIRLKWHKPNHWDIHVFEQQNCALVRYLRGLHNIESLDLCFDKEGDEDWEEHHFPLNRIKANIEHEAPPFTRLKTLRIQCAHQQRPPNVPYQVLRYFLEGSPNAEEKFVKLEMLAD